MEVHNIKYTNKQTRIYKKANNPSEIFSMIIQFVQVLGFLILILLGIFSLYNDSTISFQAFIVLLIILIICWVWYSMIKDFIFTITSLIRPVIILESSKVYVMIEWGKYKAIDNHDIRSIEGKIYAIWLGSPSYKTSYFSEISIRLKNGDSILADTIYSSLLFRPLETERVKELKRKLVLF